MRSKKIPPDGVTVKLDDPTTITITGMDKQKVGPGSQAEVRARAQAGALQRAKAREFVTKMNRVRRKEGKSFASGG